MTDKATFTLTVTEDQLEVINSALDMQSRMGMGQLDTAVEEFLRTRFYGLYYESYIEEDDAPSSRGEVVKRLIDRIKYLVFGHSPNSSYGIFNEKVPLLSRESYDLLQVFRRAVAEVRLKRAVDNDNIFAADHIRSTVSMRSYMAANPAWPPAEARVKEGPNYKEILGEAVDAIEEALDTWDDASRLQGLSDALESIRAKCFASE